MKKRTLRSNQETDEGKRCAALANSLTKKAPYKGLGAESEEKREPASDIDPGVVDGLKVLDPDGRLEKRTSMREYNQCRSNDGLGVPSTAIAPTTSSQNGSTPKPGIASRASPGNSSHCRPSTMNSSSAVPRSTTHTIGGKGVAKAPMASEMPAMAKARASRFLENLRVFEIGVPA